MLITCFRWGLKLCVVVVVVVVVVVLLCWYVRLAHGGIRVARQVGIHDW
jgi:hypothetical protein